MLFGPCAADPAATFLPAAGQLCAGGAGFVSAVIAAFAAGAKTAPAETLRDVPEVDRLAVRIVTDNVVIQFVPNETRNGLTIERKSGNTVPTSRRAPCSTASGASRCTCNRRAAPRSATC